MLTQPFKKNMTRASISLDFSPSLADIYARKWEIPIVDFYDGSTACSLSTLRHLLAGVTLLDSGLTRFSSRFTD